MKSRNRYSLVQTIDELSEADRRKMFGIMQEHFAGLSEEKFNSDLDEKNWVVRVNDASGDIQGFSTLKLMEQEIDGELIYGFYSGDTVLSVEATGDPSWIAAWGDHVFSQAELLKPAKSYWVLLSSSFRTYTIISSCYKKFLPNPTEEFDPKLRRIMSNFIKQKFPYEYDEQKNLVSLKEPVSYKEKDMINLNFNHKRANTSYFYQANPNYKNGDMLGCITEITPSNLTKVGVRLVYGPNGDDELKEELDSLDAT